MWNYKIAKATFRTPQCQDGDEVLKRREWRCQGILKLRRILTLRRMAGCHGNFVISHVKLQINAEISRQN